MGTNDYAKQVSFTEKRTCRIATVPERQGCKKLQMFKEYFATNLRNNQYLQRKSHVQD